MGDRPLNLHEIYKLRQTQLEWKLGLSSSRHLRNLKYLHPSLGEPKQSPSLRIVLDPKALASN